jgi:hypothetical protein
MPIRMAHVHFANVPGHVGRGPGDLKALLKAMLVDGINIVDPDRHSNTFVSGFVAFGAERHLDGAFATTALGVLA